jgi:futalosine hydrolase
MVALKAKEIRFLRMHLLLCAATENEIRPAMDFIRDQQLQNVEVLLTGVGLMAATYALTRSVASKRPRFIIQAGIAGCLDTALPLSKIVLVGSEQIGDLGVEEAGTFRSVSTLGFNDPNQFPWTGGRLVNKMEGLARTGFTIVEGITVNEISTSPDRINYYRNELNGQVETMEGAALHYVSLQENIPFLQLRSLSNFVGERNKSKWVMDIAIGNLNLELQRLLSKF